MFGAVPVALGVAWGTFQEEGVEVELVPLPSGRDRVLAFQAGQIDVLVTDLTSAIMLVAARPDEAVIAGSAFTPAPGARHLVMLTPVSYSRITCWEDFVAQVRGNPRLQIAIPRQSDLEFAVDQLLRSYNLVVSPDAYIGQDNLLVNATWTLFGMVSVGVFPQPYVDYLLHYEFEGKPPLAILTDFGGVTIPPEVIVVHRRVLRDRPEVVAGFFRGFRRAVVKLNATPREALVATAMPLALELFFPGADPAEGKPEFKARVDAAIAAITIPVFPEPATVDPDSFARVAEWAAQKGYLRAPVQYGTATIAPPG
jgi:NitT/TauT family transport system substrate-binding protein